MRITENRLQTYEIVHASKAASLAAECTVLLKRDGRFPLSAPCPIALFGAGVRHTVRGGGGSGEVNIRQFETIEQAMERAGFSISSKSWLDGYDAACAAAGEAFYQQLKVAAEAMGVPVVFTAIGQTIPEPVYELPLDGEADTALYVLARNSSEGGDRKDVPGDFTLTEAEIRDILAANERYENFMLVLNVGGPVDLTPVMSVKNILLLSQLGTPTSQVLADIVLGKAFPSGRLAATWAPLSAYPSTENFGNLNDTVYREGVYVGYRWFDLQEEKPLFPFGYGLDYTDYTLRAGEIRMDGSRISVAVEVKNSGSFPGKETLQLYLTTPGKEIDRPIRELAGSVKTGLLAPGESKNVEIAFDLRDHAYYDESSASVILEGGDYLLSIGEGSQSCLPVGLVNVPKSFALKKLKNICAAQRNIAPMPELSAMLERRNTAYEQALAESAELPKLRLDQRHWTTETVDYNAASAVDDDTRRLAESLSDEELAFLACGSSSENSDMGNIIGSAATKIAGAAGETTRKLLSKGIDSIVLADGPAGVRISPEYFLDGEIARPAVPAFGSGMASFLHPEDLAVMNAMMGVPGDNAGERFYQYCTAIPIGTAVAQSFDPKLAEALGELVGAEMEIFGVQLWLAPALNIQRSPLCGRNFEYYSEDPVVSGMTAAAMTRGVQKHSRCGVTVKHFVCNNQEFNRYRSNSVISERALREIYLKGFELVIREEAPASLMTSYNLINGEHTCNSHDLLTDVLRSEWRFEGLVMTDWFVTAAQIGSEKGSIYPEASAAGCVKAGNNLTMPGMATDLADIHNALKSADHAYALKREDLIRNAEAVLKTIRVFTE